MKTLLAGSTGMVGGIAIFLLFGAAVGFTFLKNTRGSKFLTEDLSEPLGGATAVKIEINAGPGNLTVDRLTGDTSLLTSGALQYLEGQGLPTRILEISDGQANLTLTCGDTKQARFRFPWDAWAGGAYQWLIHLNPTVLSDITAISSGGNMKLDLSGMTVSRLQAASGGGNMDVVLPDGTSNLNGTVSTGGGNVTVVIGKNLTGNSYVDAKSGAGKVVIYVPSEVAARIHATSGLGKVIVAPDFNQIDAHTYQSPGYETAANKIEITLSSGAGNVTVEAD